MARWTVSAVLGMGLAMGVAGCAGVPAPPREVSVALPRNTPIYVEDPNACQEADALVVAQCTRVEPYGGAGGSSRAWYLTEWRVIRVEWGYWPERTLSFVFRQRHTASPSSPYLGEVPTVYYEGVVMGFCIETSASPPAIVAQQMRSRTPPYGSLRRPRYNAGNPEIADVFQRVVEAAWQYLNPTAEGIESVEVTEEYDAFFVVEARTADGSIALRVDKNTYRVTRIPDFYAPEEMNIDLDLR